ncbi:MAG: Lpg1974 family pore-forming outer membrane protein [Nitrospinales bacterium]
MVKKRDSLKMYFLALTLVTALTIAMPEFARAEYKGFYFIFEGRGAISGGDDFPYAESTNTGEIFDLGLDASLSTRLGGGVRLNNGLDFGIFYSGLKTSSDDRQYSSGQSLYYLINPANYATTYYYNQLAHSDFELDVVDFEAGYGLKLGQVDLRLMAGLRLAIAEYNIRIVGIDLGVNPSNETVNRNTDSWGFGPRIGVGGAMPLPASGFHLVGSVSGSLLFGDIETTDSLLNLEAVQGFDSGNMFGNLEGDIGVAYERDLGNGSSMSLTMGYRAAGWLGIHDTHNTTSQTGASYGDDDANRAFHGPFLRGTLNFN